ncbi:hypothetical protein GCM10011390_30590 [Aureimonas endophytica]|uniref:Diguanylate cyclase (GGDEF)-like protein n=1 Tax=Aureimonas endophytica TaxID=2027858 RepID=A0A917E7V2_9HYPH|nr:bifunctional diguanylate cyclase/phosphodiesterase [Aureimonas endophytica]GGE09385.1 hypothetical protein GCM10011390_30590 [Aureimonas endophytica]
MMTRTSSELPRGSKIVRVGLIGLTSILAVLAVACSLLASRYQQEMIQASRYNQAFDFSQAVVEILRLQTSIADSSTIGDAKQVDLRSNILRNRIGVIGTNAFLDERDRVELIAKLHAVLDRIAPLLARLPDPDAIASSIGQLEPFITPLSRIASRAHAESGDKVMQNQNDLGRVLDGIRIATIALLVVGATLVVAMLRQNKLLDRIVRTDPLTGLANRLAFNSALRSSHAEHRAVVLVDVDYFKSINDTLGHDAGDRLLYTLARRLRDTAREATAVARIGGDEFAVLFHGPRAATQSVAFAEGVLANMREAIVIDGSEIVISVTQGVCIDGSDDYQSSLKDADIALYAAKVAGRGRYCVFEPAMKQDFLRRQKLLEDMQRAAMKDELFLVYQPIVDLNDSQPRGFEALLRWQHRELGLISPGEFIPIAEDSGLIQDLGRWVIKEACREAARWPNAMFVAVNVSARQLTDAGLVDHIARCLAENDIARGRLEIEITESSLIENDEAVPDILRRLQALGCRISLDDFGTGYASLSYLRRFRFDKLKIDQSFVRGNPSDGESTAIVSMICGLADRLGLTIVAEGIETKEQHELVRNAGSHLGQGFLFSRPLSSSAVLDLLDAHTTPPIQEAA